MKHYDGIGSKFINAIKNMDPEAKYKVEEQIKLGVLTEKDVVGDLVDEFEKNIKAKLGYNNLFGSDASSIFPIIRQARNASTFKELRQYIDTPQIRKAEAMFIKARNSQRVNDSLTRRHSDGLKDSVKKLIESLKEWIAKFKELNVGQATIVIMSKLLQAASAILAAKNAIELKKHLKALSYWGERIKKVQEKDPNFIPSKENLYFQHKAKAIFKGISVITNLVGFVLSRYAERNIINKVENNTQKKSIQAHDSKYLNKLFKKSKTMRDSRFDDKDNRKEAKRKIEENIKTAEQNLQKLEKVKNPEVQKKVKETKKRVSKFKAWFKKEAIFAAKVTGSLAIYYAELLIIFGLIAGIAKLIRLPAERRARREAEEAATRRFQQWRLAHGVTPPRVPPTPNIPPAEAPIPREAMSAVTNLERAAEGIQEGIRELDLSDVPTSGPFASPGDHGARFSGIEYDSKFGNVRNRMTTYDQMPWVRKDAGVKGMKKGQHIKARDPEYKASLQGGGGAAPSSNPAKPSTPAAKQGNNKHGKAKAIAKMLAAAAGIAGAGYLGAKAMKKMRNSFENQSSITHKAPNQPKQASNYKPKPFKPADLTKSEFSNIHTVMKNLNDPNHVYDI